MSGYDTLTPQEQVGLLEGHPAEDAKKGPLARTPALWAHPRRG